MKSIVSAGSVLSALAVVAVLVGCFANAQTGRPAPPPRDSQPRDGQPGEQDRAMRPDPFLQIFDTDGDHRLSVAEVDAIPGKLKAGDRNGDGYLEHEELPRPPRPDETEQDSNMPRQPRAPRDQPGPPRDQPGPPRDQPGPSAARSIDTSKLEKGTVVFHDGYQTDNRDGGRPIVLIAAALGVKDEVFRDAFSNVRPARDGQPTPERARENKSVLMAALGKYGISNERLDEVSNYYRYRPQAGELWTHRSARAQATIVDGQVTEVKLIDAGAGYSSVPRIEVVGYPDAKLTATVEYGTDLQSNGRIASLAVNK